jgi:hypothetical protein
MKKLFILSMAMISFLCFSANPAIADGRYGHGGHSYYGHGHGYDYWHGWDAVAVGLGAAIVGTAIVNSMTPEREVVVEHETHYYPAPAPRYRDYDYDRPDSHYVPSRVWIPGQYLYEGGGRYIYVPGHWEN